MASGKLDAEKTKNGNDCRHGLPASPFLLFQACIGLRISGTNPKISFVRPLLPPFLNEARISNLQVAGASVDLALVRHNQDVSVNVLRRQGDVEIVIVT